MPSLCAVLAATEFVGSFVTKKFISQTLPRVKLNSRLLSACQMAGNETVSALTPPSSVRGLKKVDRSLFTKLVRIPCLRVSEASVNSALKHLKPFLLKMDNLKPVQDDSNGSTEDGVTKVILLNPQLTNSFETFQPHIRNCLNSCGVSEKDFEWIDKTLTYENWKHDQILDSVLPENDTKSSSYSRIGHIVHLNLRDHLLDYRFLIGEVLLDKLKGVTCVINKSETIDNTYRNFKMEVIAGDDNTKVKVKENGCLYEFDFSLVFWNPRLCTEHERLVEKLPPECVLYDVFAGVGPFAIPAARKRKCDVLANDLNPHSYTWLKHNVKLNKVDDRVKVFNMDGREFIKEIVKTDLISRWQKYTEDKKDASCTPPPLCHIAMNLPALAVTFLDAFIGLLSEYDNIINDPDFIYPIVHCYMFSKEEDYHEDCIQQVQEAFGHHLDRNNLEVFLVRNVAPNKEMLRVTFCLTREILLEKLILKVRDKPEMKVPAAKRPCVIVNAE